MTQTDRDFCIECEFEHPTGTCPLCPDREKLVQLMDYVRGQECFRGG